MGGADHLGQTSIGNVPTVTQNEQTAPGGRSKNPLSIYVRCLQTILLKIRPAPLASMLKRILRVRRTVIETPLGQFWIDPVSNLGRALSQEGVYEPGMQQTLSRFLKTGGVFIDLGANEGYFAVLAAKAVGADGRVCQRRRQNASVGRSKDASVRLAGRPPAGGLPAFCN